MWHHNTTFKTYELTKQFLKFEHVLNAYCIWSYEQRPFLLTWQKKFHIKRSHALCQDKLCLTFGHLYQLCLSIQKSWDVWHSIQKDWSLLNHVITSHRVSQVQKLRSPTSLGYFAFIIYQYKVVCFRSRKCADVVGSALLYKCGGNN